MTIHKPPHQVDVCIVGCGPAGAMLGLLLARAGIEVVVLEKYPDFHRDFRGDTIHASTLQVLDELDLMPAFDRLPHQPTRTIAMMTDDGLATLGDFSRLPGPFQYLSMVPQWDFLAMLTTEAAKYPSFTLIRSAVVTDLVVDRAVVRGVRYEAGGRPEELRAALTVACDGRHSVVRAAAGLAVKEYGVPLDVLWLRILKGPDDPSGSFARLGPGRLFPVIDRGSYWQAAVTMTKGGFGSLRSAGLAAFRADLSRWLPFPADRIDEAVQSWDDTGFLEVRVNRLRRWHRPGLLCIGDAAHAMSPVAGVGINLAIQDAVAAANLLTEGLRSRGTVTDGELAAVQRRRALPARLTQRIQLLVQRQLISDSGDPDRPVHLPRPLRVLSRVGPLRRQFSRFLALGVRNEHVAPPLGSQRRSVWPHAVAVPATGLLAGALPRVDWADAYAVVSPVGARIDPQVWADAIFHHAPRWVRGLLGVRQAIVGLVGIDRGRPHTFATRTDDEVLLGTDERHLSFRASVLSRTDRVVLSTVVQIHNRRGQAYSAVVRLLHPLVVRAVLGRATRHLSVNH